MNSMTHRLFRKFCQWSSDDLQGQPGEVALGRLVQNIVGSWYLVTEP
jgi:hypothetical protein